MSNECLCNLFGRTLISFCKTAQPNVFYMSLAIRRTSCTNFVRILVAQSHTALLAICCCIRGLVLLTVQCLALNASFLRLLYIVTLATDVWTSRLARNVCGCYLGLCARVAQLRAAPLQKYTLITRIPNILLRCCYPFSPNMDSLAPTI